MSNITYKADEYADSKKFPFRIHVEKYTIFELLGDPTGKRVLDAGCGDGIYSRQLVDQGASFVIGVDGAKDFIELTKQKNGGYEERIQFVHSFIQDFPGNGDLDSVIASYVLSYPKSLEEATAYCKAMASHLKSGGKLIGFNNNPFEVFDGVRHAEYGFEKEMHGDTEGSLVIYRVAGMDNPIVNFHLHPKTYERAFREAGFSEFRWQRVLLNPNQQGNSYWNNFFSNEPSFVAMLAMK